MKKTASWKVALALISAGALAPPVQARFFSRKDKGTTAGQVLSLGAGARAMGMGEAFTAVADDATAVFWNPGGLVQIPRAALSFMHASYVGSIFFDHLSFAQRLSARTVVGGAVQYLDYGSIEGTDVNNLDAGSFHPRDYVYSLAYARDLDFIAFGNEAYSFGVNAKFLRSTIVDTANSYHLDLGILSRFDTESGRRIRAGFALHNLGRGLKYDQARDPIPTTFRGGVSYPVTKNWLLSLDAVLPKGNGLALAAGTELAATVAPHVRASLRAGLNTATWSDLRGTDGLSLGAGLTAALLSFDYAFLPMGELGSTHRLSVSIRFPGRVPEAEESIFEIQKKLLEP